MSVPIIRSHSTARRICPDCNRNHIGKPTSRRCIECTAIRFEALAHQNRMRRRQKRLIDAEAARGRRMARLTGFPAPSAHERKLSGPVGTGQPKGQQT